MTDIARVLDEMMRAGATDAEIAAKLRELTREERDSVANTPEKARSLAAKLNKIFRTAKKRTPKHSADTVLDELEDDLSAKNNADGVAQIQRVRRDRAVNEVAAALKAEGVGAGIANMLVDKAVAAGANLREADAVQKIMRDVSGKSSLFGRRPR